MDTNEATLPDVMQVCRNGHVITDRLQTYPERSLSRCDRCGAATLDRCPTCGQPLPGANSVPGLATLGTLAAPQCCSHCGALFPWSQRMSIAASLSPLDLLETVLRRVPIAIRQLRIRHDVRPPFRVQDAHDLEDLFRAVLPLSFEEVRSESRTPAYESCTRIDFRLGQGGGTFPTALTAKLAGQANGASRLLEQWREDISYYERLRDCRLLVAFVYDPEGLLREPRQLESIWSKSPSELKLRCVIAP